MNPTLRPSLASLSARGGRKIMFYDTSVLINFHRAALLPNLTKLLGGDVAWVATVQMECARKERELALPGLKEAAEGLLGEPLRPEQGEHLPIRQLRSMMAEPGDHEEAHLGEAETLTLIEKRRLNAIIAADDRSVARFAGSTATVNTWGLLRFCFSRGCVTLDEAMTLWKAFGDSGGTWPKHLATKENFVDYLNRRSR